VSWLQKTRENLKAGQKLEVPGGLWIKCEGCGEALYKKELEKTLWTCPKCEHHFRISAPEFIPLITDSFIEFDSNLTSLDPLNFKAIKRYKDQLKAARQKTGLGDAFVSGEATLDGLGFYLGAMDFNFMGGSMGSVVGEKFARLGARALEARRPLVVSSQSGGARMQEGVLSLMQMAKTTAALTQLSARRLPFISVLTDPTMGGVSASFAMLGDVVIAEPRALIGFAGPRVIEQTVREKLPEGFQRSEFLLEKGAIDMIVDRRQMCDRLAGLLTLLQRRPPAGN